MTNLFWVACGMECVEATVWIIFSINRFLSMVKRLYIKDLKLVFDLIITILIQQSSEINAEDISDQDILPTAAGQNNC